MGVVYRATDVRLKRSVAIKVLPAAFTADPERVARFEREAQLLASLNHPNIAQVYGFEHAPLPDGSAGHYLAMELIEGEDLEERLRRARSPWTTRSRSRNRSRKRSRKRTSAASSIVT